MDHFDNIQETKRIAAKLGSKGAIRSRAKRIRNQSDAEDASSEIREDSYSLMRLASPIDFASSFRFWRMTAVLAAFFLLGVTVWLVSNDGEIAGANMYVTLVITCLSLVILPFAVSKANSIRNTANLYPSVIDRDHVVAARRFVNTFGETFQRGRLLIIAGGGVDAMLAAWFMLGVFSALAVVVKVAAVFGLVLVFIASITAMANAFSTQLRRIRARHTVRTKEQSIKRGSNYNDDVEYLRSQFGTRYGTDFRQNRWTDYAVALLPLAGIVSLFGMVILVRLLVPPSDDALSIPVLVTVSTLCCLIAISGAVLGSDSHLLPEVGKVQTAIAKRFPTEAAFEQWRESTDATIMRTANQKASALQAICAEADNESEQANVKIPPPFTMSTPVPKTSGASSADGMASGTFSGSNVTAFSTVVAGNTAASPSYSVKWTRPPAATA